MTNRKNSGQYQTIARDIAIRIMNNEWPENHKISGRSLLSSEYNVSPETVRRALALLSDMKVVTIKKNSGVYILSADNAKRYLSDFDDIKDQKDMQNELKELIEKNNDINKRMYELLSMLIKTQNTISYVKSRFPDYEVKISPDSKIIGKNIGSIRFWQNTNATIIAIKRGQSVIVSPGPDAELYQDDTIVFVGTAAAAEKVKSYING
ncbi:MAG TPA: TrkA C-terminal domain-containing protein [Clostridia bacterium]|jgi:K+/H+ antiporter YhaU regulatory subunit KhtT|nr:GntR family transcriptional regulator [Clostridia bacterium]HPB16145.1 TrkA C-terminal domain-containing protein [Clostridia bacterium]HQM95382.1 TrkA C-terminal domain-containing protein [Clostridia bacterium]HQO68744.1 TrkA C-terminal domain-containing protein [Clostridia bacterium]